MFPLNYFFSESRAKLNKKDRSYPRINWAALALIIGLILVLGLCILAAAQTPHYYLIQG